jgi:hypothetical protein
MTRPTPPLIGGCRCGEVRFRIDAPPLVTMACHCRGCQKMTASAFSLSALVPSQAFSVTGREPVIGGLHGPNRHYFCPHCLSWMFTRPEGADGLVNVRATLLDDAAWVSPFMETCTAEKLDWVTTPAAYSFEGFPPLEAYDGILRAYAQARAS